MSISDASADRSHLAVGIVTTWFERGAAYVSRAYCDALRPHFDVQIYARGGEHMAKGDPVWDRPEVWWGCQSVEIDRRDFERWLTERRIGIVLFNEQQWWPPVLWAREARLPTVAYVDYYKKWTVSWFGAYDRLLCHTLRHYSVFRWHPGAVYVPWGTDTAVFRPVPRDGTGDLVFFHSAGMGGIHTRKGTDLLVRAFQTVSGPARLVIHSQVPVDRYGEAVAAAIRENPRIEFREGSVTAPGLYCLGDVYVYPTRLDGIGLSVPEALASGLPVIATNVAPCSEFVTHGYNGWLVDVARTKYRDDGYYWPETECDVDALARAMQHCVDQRSQLPAWRMAARASAEERLCWETNARQLPGLFASWMATPPGSTPLLVRAQLALAYPSGPGIPRGVARTCRRAIRQLLSLVHRR